MTLGFLSDTARLSREKAAVEALAEEAWFRFERWALDGLDLEAWGVVLTPDGDRPVRLVYPREFPLVPAYVLPQKRGSRWSEHQYGGGSLCLEHRVDNWDPSVSGEDLLRSVHKLLTKEGSGAGGDPGGVASAHEVSPIQQFDWGEDPVFIHEGLERRLSSGEAVDVSAVRWWTTTPGQPVMVTDGVDKAEGRAAPAVDVFGFTFAVSVRLSSTMPDPLPATSAELLQVCGLAEKAAAEPEETLVLVVDAGAVSALYATKDSVARRKLVLLKQEQGSRSGRSAEARAVSVAIIGAGSLGSKLAETLVRSGLRKLLLVDGDILLPGNLDRHVLEWRDIGARKVAALKSRLLRIAPDAEVETISQNLAWQRSSMNHASETDRIGQRSIIVDATADPGTTLLLAAIAQRRDRVFITGEVFEGGLGCLLTMTRPGVDRDFASARTAYHAWCAEQPSPPHVTSVAGLYGGYDEEGDPLIADDAAVTVSAGLLARVVLDRSESIPPKDGETWLLIGQRAGWVFDGLGHTIRLDVGRAGTTAEPEDDPAMAAFVQQLQQEAFLAAKTDR